MKNVWSTLLKQQKKVKILVTELETTIWEVAFNFWYVLISFVKVIWPAEQKYVLYSQISADLKVPQEDSFMVMVLFRKGLMYIYFTEIILNLEHTYIAEISKNLSDTWSDIIDKNKV